MKILVTGGCGYKGSVLVPKLLEAGYEVVVVDIQWFGNHLKPHPLLTVLKEDVRNIERIPLQGVDAIIHLASVANDPCCELSPKLTWEISALSTMQLVDAAVKNHIKQFIYASSGSVYGVSDDPNVTEETELKPLSEYNKAKMVAEAAANSYKDKILLQIVRPATVCGYSPRMRLDVSVNMLTMQALSKGVITVFGGNQIRPNIHIDDITDLYLFLLKNKTPGTFNAGFENLSILDIAKQVTSFIPAEIKVTESNDPRSYRINSDKLLKIFQPKKTIKIAIEEMIQLYKENILKDMPQFYNLQVMKEFEL